MCRFTIQSSHIFLDFKQPPKTKYKKLAGTDIYQDNEMLTFNGCSELGAVEHGGRYEWRDLKEGDTSFSSQVICLFPYKTYVLSLDYIQ